MGYLKNKKTRQKQLNDIVVGTAKRAIEDGKFAHFTQGAVGILGFVLDMCKEGKSVKEIHDFCEKSLNMEEMKKYSELVERLNLKDLENK